MYVARVRTEMADFEVYQQAAVRAIDAEPLYRASDGHYQFKYLPAFALAMAPFAWVSPEVAKPMWFGLSVALLWIFVAWSIEGLPGRRRTTPILAWVTILLMGKFYAHELNLGQTNILLGVILIGVVLAVQRGQWARAGALAGLGVFVKPYAAITLPWLLPSAGLVGVMAAGAVLLVGLLLPAVVYGWQGNIDLLSGWYHTVTDTTAPNLLQPENVSLATMWAKWIGVGPLATQLAAISVLAALAIVAWVVWQRGHVDGPAYLEFGMLMLLVPLISPQGWDYVLLLATPAVICLVDRFDLMAVGWRVATALAMAAMSFTIYDVLGRTLYTRLMAINIVSVSAIGLFLCLAHLRRRSVA
jgi:Glycosyltransferase family 87